MCRHLRPYIAAEMTWQEYTRIRLTVVGKGTFLETKCDDDATFDQNCIEGYSKWDLHPSIFLPESIEACVVEALYILANGT